MFAKKIIQSTRKELSRFAADEEATTSVEYAIMIVFIVGACLAAVGMLAQATQQSFNDSANALP